MKKQFNIIFGIFVTIILLSTSISYSQGLKPDKAAPDFRLISIEGDTIASADYSGKIAVIQFWENN